MNIKIMDRYDYSPYWIDGNARCCLYPGNKIAWIVIMMAMSAGLLLSSCNSDVFIASDDLPEVTDVTLDGNGGQWSSAFSRMGLTRVYVNPEDSSDDAKYLKYYSVNGGVVDSSCPPSELEEIIYETPLLHYSIGLAERLIYFDCLYNVSSERTVRICLEYEHGMTKTINLTMSAGKPVKMEFWMPTGEPILEWDFERIPHRTSLANNSSLTQTLQLDPFEASVCSDQVVPADSWAIGLTFDMPMPVFFFQEWAWEESKDIRLGERRTFPQTVYAQDRLKVEVPPYTKATVTYTLNFSRFTQKGYISLYNPVDKSWFDEDVTWTAVYATSYDYTVDYE